MNLVFIVASSMSIGIIGILWMDEPQIRDTTTNTQNIFIGLFINDLSRFFFSFGVRQTFYISLFILLYNWVTIWPPLLVPFYLDMGFSKTTIGTTVNLHPCGLLYLVVLLVVLSCFVSVSTKLFGSLVPYRCLSILESHI